MNASENHFFDVGGDKFVEGQTEDNSGALVAKLKQTKGAISYLALSFKDDLTVAQNRRCLEAELPQAVRSAAAKAEPLALLFIDVDDLKRVNTAHGHPVGSLLLESVAATAQRLCRAHDRLYRYGGDEFCILMPGTTAQGARKLGERLLQVLQEHPLDLGRDQLAVSLSAGVAAYPEHADGAGRLIEQADHALLRAKQEGKGRVMVALQ